MAGLSANSIGHKRQIGCSILARCGIGGEKQQQQHQQQQRGRRWTITRSIISQIPSPTYNIAKQLCAILTPYVPSTYSLNSTTDILDILKANSANGIIASLDVEKLFTHIPIDRAINYIIYHVYHNNSTPNVAIPESTLRVMLMCWTKEVPSTCPRGEKYQQVDGVPIVPRLEAYLQNFIWAALKKKRLIRSKINKIYCRYIDNIFIQTKCSEDIEVLKNDLQDTSGLIFTVKNSIEGSMPFLDILALVKQK
ncbi:uncharacterized protein LOC143037005 [Oratosquilla oratoria]|uniref:uncharacterized protein LOC143037005 n=1 Tax=Oratosquilla oratoria TaxID=337810 RepID=UPI003F7602FE